MKHSQTLKNIRVYDNGGQTVDRYTVVFMAWKERAPNTYTALAMNDTPFHPQGFGQHCTAMPGKHLGRRIMFEQLPTECQRCVLQDLKGEEHNGTH